MFGLIVLIVFVVYLSLLVWATRRGWRWGIEKKGWTGRKRYLGAAIGFLIVYLPVFWDWLPTVVVHQYYCAKDSGFWVYKTLEQWKKENPGVMETLVANELRAPAKHDGDEDNWTNTYEVNQRINQVSKHEGPLPFYRWRFESQLVDGKTNDVLVRTVDFYTAQVRAGGGWHGWKFWLATSHCPTHPNSATHFGNYLSQIRGAKK